MQINPPAAALVSFGIKLFMYGVGKEVQDKIKVFVGRAKPAPLLLFCPLDDGQ